jgi:hypothetical protein
MKQRYPDLKDWQVKLLMIKEKMAQVVISMDVNITRWNPQNRTNQA